MYQISFLADGQLLDRALDAALELAEPLLARHQVGAAGLEHGPAFVLPAACASSRRNVVLPTRCSPLTSSDRVGVCSDAASAATRSSRQASGSISSSVVFAVGPEAAERGQECAIDVRALDVVELPYQRRGMRDD